MVATCDCDYSVMVKGLCLLRPEFTLKNNMKSICSVKIVHNFNMQPLFPIKAIYNLEAHKTRNAIITTDWTHDLICPIGNSSNTNFIKYNMKTFGQRKYSVTTRYTVLLMFLLFFPSSGMIILPLSL